jgi:hypothetical protein
VVEKSFFEFSDSLLGCWLFSDSLLANEGWLIECPLLPGSRHPRKAFNPLLQRALAKIRQISKDKLLLRADSAHDAVANRVELSRHDDVDYIIKWNPRKQDPEAWKTQAFSKGTVETPRPGKRVAIFSVLERHSATGENGKEKELAFRRVMRVRSAPLTRRDSSCFFPRSNLRGGGQA